MGPTVLRAALALWAAAAAATGGGDWLDGCEARPPCVQQGQCVADEVPCAEDLVQQEGAAVCGCCPGCVRPLGSGESCPNADGRPCGDGLSCQQGKCTEGLCTREKSKTHAEWRPSCRADGSFAAVQCKGTLSNGRCFCWSPDGTRLDGQRAWDSGQIDMTCGCAVRAWELAKESRVHEAPRCTTDGSFEQLQCAKGVCWCADKETGAPRGRTVPEGAMALLFCYVAGEVGTSYRRRCDSQLEARERIRELMEPHGTTAHGLPYVACDLDGSFGPVQHRDGNQYFCSQKNKKQIQGFVSTDSTTMNCKCARDKVDLNNELLACDTNGNHLKEKEDDGKAFCVDDDGFFINWKTGSTCWGVFSS